MEKNKKLTDEDKRQFIRTFRFAMRTAKFMRAGKYRLAALLMSRNVKEITLKDALERIKRDRLTMRHRLHVGGQYNQGRTLHFAHCECGWSGENVPDTEKTFKEMQKTICPVFIRECKCYNLDPVKIWEVR